MTEICFLPSKTAKIVHPVCPPARWSRPTTHMDARHSSEGTVSGRGGKGCSQQLRCWSILIPMRRVAIVKVFLLLSTVMAAQEEAQPRWSLNFERFSVAPSYKGKPAPAQIVSKSDRLFRTRIREGAREGPNFAGRFTVVEWGCGSGCISFAVVDAVTGRVYRAPFALLGVPYLGTKSGRAYQGLVYRLNSRLLIADGCPQDGNCGTYYLEWTGRRWNQIKFEQAEQKESDE